jgi:hypothetical protein
MYRIIGADGREYGPISADQLRRWISENRANAETRVLVEGSAEWRTLGSLPEFSMLFVTARPQPATPAVFPTATMSGQRASGFAVAGLILGICSIPSLCCCYGIPFNILGLIFSIVGLSQISDNPQRYTGKGIAITGLVLSIISLAVSVLILIIAGFGRGWNGLPHHVYKL